MANTVRLSIPKGESRVLRFSRVTTADDDGGMPFTVQVSGQASARANLYVETDIRSEGLIGSFEWLDFELAYDPDEDMMTLAFVTYDHSLNNCQVGLVFAYGGVFNLPWNDAENGEIVGAGYDDAQLIYLQLGNEYQTPLAIGEVYTLEVARIEEYLNNVTWYLDVSPEDVSVSVLAVSDSWSYIEDGDRCEFYPFKNI